MKKLMMIFLFVLMCTVGYGQELIGFLGKNLRETKATCNENSMVQYDYAPETEENFGLLNMVSTKENFYSFYFHNNICIKSSVTTDLYLYAKIISTLDKEYLKINNTTWMDEKSNVFINIHVEKFIAITFKYKGY